MNAPRHVGSKRGYHVAYLNGGKFEVRDPSGRPLGAPTNHGAAHERAARLQDEADARAKRGPRACLCCGAVFQSEGIHNRMCTPCRGLGDPLGAYGYQGAGAGRKPRRSSGA